MLKILSILLLLCGSWAQAADLAWNASVVDAEHGVPDGYRVYYGYAVDQLTTAYDVGAELNFVIPETWDPATYYFGVRAYNAYGESGWATTPEGQTWVAYTKSDPPPVEPPAAATDVRIVWEQIEEPYMSFSIVQAVVDDGNNNTVSLTGVTAGNLIVVLYLNVSYPATTSTSCSDGTSSLTAANIVVGDFQTVSIFFLSSANSGNRTYTVTRNGTVSYERVTALEFSKAGTISIAAQNGASGVDGTISSNSISASSGNLLIGAVISYAGEISTLRFEGTTPDADYSSSPGGALGGASRLTLSSGFSGSYTATGGGYWSSKIVAFAETASASAVPKIMLLQDHFSGGVH